METIRPCGCKGIRTCLLCESEFNINKPDLSLQLKVRLLNIMIFIYFF